MNEFDQAASQVAGPEADPIARAAAEVVGAQRTTLRSTLYNSLLANPEMAARAQKLGRQTGVPADVVERNLPEVQRNAQLDEFDKVLKDSPAVAQWLMEQNNAKVAHDDVENLSEHERMFRKALAAGRAVQGQVGQTYRRSPDQMVGEDRGVLGAITEPVQRGLAQGRRGLTLLFNELGIFDGLQRQRDSARVAAGLAPEGNADLAVRLAQQQRQIERFPVPENIARGMQEISGAATFGEAFSAAASNPLAVLETSLQSVGGSAPALVGAMAGSTAGPLGTAAGAGLGSFAVEYGNTLQEVMAESGVNPSDPLAISNALANQELMGAAREKAVKRGLPIAAFDAITAGLAGRLLAGAKPTVASVGGRAAGELALQAGGGAAGEATAQAVTGEWRPGDILLEALAELPSSVVEVPANYRDAVRNAQTAEQSAQTLEQLDQLAAASKVRQRDADTFEAFIAQVSEDGPVQNVYLDANTLMQSGMAEQLAAVSPSVAEQLPAALVAGGEIQIPVAEYTARIAGTEYSQGLIDDIRVEGEQFTRRQAQEYMQNEAEELQAEVDRAVGEQQLDDEFKASQERVKQRVLDELNTVGRFTADKNELDATLIAARSAVRAAQLGMTPEQFFEKQLLRVQAESVTGGEVLSQGETLGDVLAQWDEAGIRNAVSEKDGTITVSQIVVPESDRGTGKGTSAMQALVDYADRTGQRIALTPSSDFGGSKKRLTEFYKRFGFVDNKGRTKDFATRESMVRQPQQLNQSNQPLPATINIDGKDRPTTNSKGQAIAATEQGVRNFWKWFGDSKVVDAEGRPLVVYHGTNAKITEFKNSKKGARDPGFFGKGFYFTPSEDDALSYADSAADADGEGDPKAIPVYLSLQNPFVWDMEAGDGAKATLAALRAMGIERTFVRGDAAALGNADERKKFTKAMDAGGHDGVFVRDEDGFREIVAFNPTQIKSAIGNSGEFDPGNANILMQSAYHGTPYRGIDKFSTDKIGTGEGNQAFGWGLYFAGKKEVAEYYRNSLASQNVTIDGDSMQARKGGRLQAFAEEKGLSPADAEALDDVLNKFFPNRTAKSLAEAVKNWRDAGEDETVAARVEKLVGRVEITKGQLYEVDIPEDSEMLHFDKPMTSQPDKVKRILKDSGLWKELKDNLSDFASPQNTRGNLKGENIYAYLAWKLGSEKAASEKLLALGVPGMRYPGGTISGVKSTGYNYVIFSGDDVAITNQFYQNKAGPRGSFSPSNNTITLLKNADLSTFLHEAGHYFFEGDIALAAEIIGSQREGASTSQGEQQILDDVSALLRWHGIQGSINEQLNTWYSLQFEEKRAYHERTAESFEAYLFEGKAPSIELQPMFQKFRAWLLNVYRSLKDFLARNPEAGKLNDEVRAVFDRMLATTEQIQLAEQARSMLPLFETPDQAGMTVDEFAAYQALGIDATNDAIQDVQARTLRDLAWTRSARSREIKKLQKKSDTLRKEVEAEVRREVMSQPVYRAWQFLTGKEGEQVVPGVTDPNTVDTSQARGKLRTAAVKELGAPDDVVSRVMSLRMTSPEGSHPDIVADMFGFSSGDELVRTLAAATPPKDEIEGLTDARMLERYGDLATPEAIERAADSAIHNEARARFVATEANALAKATGKPKILASAARDFARATVSRLKVRAIRPNQYATAEVRAAKAAQKASQSGDLATAAAEKRNQLVQNYLTRAAYDAQDEVEKGLRYLRKFDSEGTRKGLDADYVDQIDALLERFDLRKGVTLKAIDKRTALAAWAESQREQGLEPEIPADLLNEALRKSYKDMTVEELRGLIDTVKQIEHLGRLKNRLLTAADNRAFEAVKTEIVTSIEANSKGRTADTRTPTTNLGRLAQSLKNFGAAHIKAATWARVLDGGKDGGPMWEYLVRSANERGNQETTMRAEATEALTQILAPVFKLGRMGGSGQFFPTINRSLNREARIALALNTGNQGNLQRLLGGEGWTVQQIQPVLQSLSATEWQAVQAVWDHFESYRPQIGAKERRVYGREPEWVEPTPFQVTTSDGEQITLKGGYYPIKYDPAASQRAEEFADAEGAKRQLQGAFTSATTRRSFTKSRVEEVSGRPLLYTLSGLYSGVNDVIHDLAWHEWLIDANRILRSKSIDAAIRNTYGPAVKQQFKSWVQDIAEGDRGAQNAAEVALSRLRQGVSAAGLGFNAMSAAMQITGFNQSIVRVGAKWIGKGIAQYIASPVESARSVVEMSPFMADRSRTQFRELNELRNRVQDESATMRNIKLGTYYMMMRMQRMVDVPTWLGAYEKAIAEGHADARAAALADQAVIDSQGSGMVKDLSAVERGGPALKLFTVFYSYMNTALNMGVAQTMTAKSKGKLAADLVMLYTVPVVLGSVLKAALTPGGDDEWDPEKLARKLAAEQLSYLMGLMVVVREFGEVSKIVTGAEGAGRDYSGPAGLRAISDAYRFTQQAAQGEFDDSFRKASINLLGDFTGLPAAQINRTITGVNALAEGETDNPAAAVFGFQQ